MANINLINVAPKDVADAHYANTTDAHNLTVRLAAKADLVGGVVPQAQLPSYVDDILEFANLAAFPVTGETGKVYIAIDTGKQYRWSGSAYVQISNGFIATTDDVPEGSTNLYFTFLRVLTGVLTGFVSGANTPIAATDTLAQALAKIQGQINARATTNDLNNGLSTKASAQFVENISLQDSSTGIVAQTYTLELYAQYAYTINELRIISGSGTCTAAVKINATDVTGISAVSVSTSIATGTASAANTVAVGDKITLVITSPSSLNNLQASLKTTRI